MRRWIDLRALHIALLLSLASPAAYATTWVVGPAGTPGVTHTTLQAAVNNALDDDTIVVLPGQYAQAKTEVPHKRLTIVGSGATTTTIGSITQPSPFGGPIDTLVLRDLGIRAYHIGAGVTTGPPIALSGGSALIVEGCDLIGISNFAVFPGPAVQLTDVGYANFTRCRLRAGNGQSNVSPGQSGKEDGADAVIVSATSATSPTQLLLHDCVIEGGTGADKTGFCDAGGSGGVGMVATNARVRAFATEFRGGNTGPGTPMSGDGTGVPGAGAVILGGTTIEHQGCSFTSGIDVPSGVSPSPPPLDVQGGNETPIAGTPALVETSGKSAVGTSATLAIHGQPSAATALLVGTPFPFVEVAGLIGPLGMTPQFGVFVLASLPASGTLQATLPIPPLPAGLKSATVGVQGYLVPTGAPIALTNVSVATVVIPGL